MRHHICAVALLSLTACAPIPNNGKWALTYTEIADNTCAGIDESILNQPVTVRFVFTKDKLQVTNPDLTLVDFQGKNDTYTSVQDKSAEIDGYPGCFGRAHVEDTLVFETDVFGILTEAKEVHTEGSCGDTSYTCSYTINGTVVWTGDSFSD